MHHLFTSHFYIPCFHAYDFYDFSVIFVGFFCKHWFFFFVIFKFLSKNFCFTVIVGKRRILDECWFFFFIVTLFLPGGVASLWQRIRSIREQAAQLAADKRAVDEGSP